MGSFRLAAGRRYLHRHFNFTESAVETATKSLRRSCTSELTRQGTSLRCVADMAEQWTENPCLYNIGLTISVNLCMSPCSSDYIFIRIRTECLACSLWGFRRRILCHRWGTDSHR